MKRALFVAALVTVFCAASAQTRARSAAASSASQKALAIYAPRPPYPLEGRKRHLTGSGTVLLQVDEKTGYVISGRILQSTGHVILDNAALSAFTRWRFRPGTVRQVRMPFNYTLRGKT